MTLAAFSMKNQLWNTNEKKLQTYIYSLFSV